MSYLDRVNVEVVAAAYKDRLTAILGDQHTLTFQEIPDYKGIFQGGIKTPSGQAAMWGMRIMPGCCGVVISFNTLIYIRRKGLGTLLGAIKKDIARQAGYAVMLCTDVMRNTPQRKILEKNGWKDLAEFTNKRTGNNVAISMVEL